LKDGRHDIWFPGAEIFAAGPALALEVGHAAEEDEPPAGEEHLLECPGTGLVDCLLCLELEIWKHGEFDARGNLFDVLFGHS